MPRVAANLLANFVGSAWSVLISLIFIPIYIRYLGMEAYGLIGIGVTIATILSLADFGLAAAAAREMARDWSSAQSVNEGRRALATVSRLYFALAAALGGLIVVLAPVIAAQWVNPQQLSEGTTVGALRVIGVLSGLQLMAAFFAGTLMALQRQILANAIAVVTALVQALGAVLVLEHYGGDVVAFFWWQSVATGISLLVLVVTVRSCVPRGPAYAATTQPVLRRLMPFAFGMSGISLLSILLTQTDKFVLSKLVSLEEFGYYTLATVVALSLRRLFGPLFAAVYPRFIELVRRQDADRLKQLYHLASQATAAVVLPAAFTLVLYAREVVFVWTGDMAIAAHTQTLIALLAGGMALTGVAQTPYALQLAHGWTRLPLAVNVVSAVFFVPAVYVLGRDFGGEGAAMACLVLNLVYLAIQVPIMHTRLLVGERSSWYVRDTLLPAAAGLLVLASAYPILPYVAGERLTTALLLAAAALLSFLATAFAGPDLRRELLHWLNGGRT